MGHIRSAREQVNSEDLKALGEKGGQRDMMIN